MIVRQTCKNCCFIIIMQVVMIVGFLTLDISKAESGVKRQGFSCQGYNTALYSEGKKLVAICHGLYAEFNRKQIEQWQDCYDSTLYARDKNTRVNIVIVDCSPVRYARFRLVNGTLEVKYYYDPYSSVEQEPFILEKYDISTSSSTYKIIADIESYTRKDIQETVQLMDVEMQKPFDGKTYFNVIYDGFDKIRAYAKVDPVFSMKILRDYASRNVFDGEVSERLSATIDDVELLKKARLK